MQREKRTQQPSVPADYESLLTEQQRKSLKSFAGWGWSIWFIRRGLFQPRLVVLSGPSGGARLGAPRYGVLRENGTLDSNPSIELRS